MSRCTSQACTASQPRECQRFQTGDIPAWLRPPRTKPLGGEYEYFRYLSTLRDGLDANLYGVVWENAKPGPGQFGAGESENAVNRSFPFNIFQRISPRGAVDRKSRAPKIS